MHARHEVAERDEPTLVRVELLETRHGALYRTGRELFEPIREVAAFYA